MGAHKKTGHTVVVAVDEISRKRIKANLIPSLQGYPGGKTTALSVLSDFEYIHINRSISREGRLSGSSIPSVKQDW